MGGTIATLDGKPCLSSVSWGLSSGVAPRTAIVTLTPRDADALLGAGSTGGSGSRKRTHTLRFEGGGRSATFRGIYVLHEVAAPIPSERAILIADRRWLWKNCVYRRWLNVRRKIGVRQLTSPNQLDARNVEPKFAYAPWSLRDGATPWTAATLLADLADEIRRWESSEGAEAPTVDTSGAAGIAAPLQDLELDGTLDTAIARALAYLPGVDVTVDAGGEIRFFRRDTGAESEQIESAGREAMHAGHIAPVSFRALRPRKVRVYFSLEAEARIDTEELASTSSTSARSEDGWWAENVLPSPDYSATISGATVPAGTWVTFAEALPAWGALPNGGGTLDFRALRLAGVPFNGLWNRAGLLGSMAPDTDWTSRIAAAQSHYRRTYRINRRIMDRISDVRAYRVATINQETGTRGDATVWSDFSYLASERSMIAEAQNSQAISYVMNVALYPTSGNLADAGPAAPASVSVVDSDQGIYRIEYLATTNRAYESALPSQVEIDGTNTTPGHLVASAAGGPSPFLRQSSRGIAWNLLGRFQSPYALTASHKTITILTVCPASPNSKRALCWVDVYPGEVEAFPGQGSCEGPALEVRVGPGLETARLAWVDSRAEDIRAAITATDDRPVAVDEDYPLADLVTNYAAPGGNAASLTAIARATAARIWHALRDRSVGSASFALAGGLRIEGSIAEIEHEVSATGAILSRIALPGRVEPLDMTRYLDASTARVLARIINPGR